MEKIEDQLADNAMVIERMGGWLGEPLSDGLSAWKRGVRRPGWERLLERVESGESDGMVSGTRAGCCASRATWNG